MADYHYSLIVPHHNNHKLLQRLLRSIPYREDLQVIVVDDCSNKDLEELNKIESEYHWVEWYSTGINGGGGKARNEGLRHAKGKYLIFADSDDYFTEEFSNFLDKYKSIDFDILYFCPLMINDETIPVIVNNDNWIINGIKKYNKTKDINYIKFHFTQPWCKIIRREIVEKNNIWFEESIISNDVRFSTLVDYYSDKIIAIEDGIYVWAYRSGSTSHKLSEKKILKRLQIDIERHNFLKSIRANDHNEYLAMLYHVYDNKSMSLKSNAYKLMKSLNVAKVDILKIRTKRFIKKLIGRMYTKDI